MVTRDQLLNHLKNDVYVRIQRSSVHGVGLFAIKRIPKGVNPFHSLHQTEYIDYPEKELQETLEPAVYDMIDAYSAKEEGRIYVPAHGYNPIDLPYLINHSDTPNVGTDEDGEHFVTLREIEVGEELFSDFSTYHDGNEHYIKNTAQ